MRRNQLRVGTLFRIRTDVTVASLLALACGALCLLYFRFASFREELEFVALVIGGASAVYSAYYVGSGLHKSVHHEKIERALELCQKYSSGEMAEFRTNIASFAAKEMKPSEICDKISTDTNLLVAARSLLGLFEDISIAVQEDHVDERFIHLCFDFAIPNIFYILKPYIEQEREVHKRDTFYCETEKLIHAWKAGVYLSSREPLPEV